MGRHLLADLYGIAAPLLQDERALMRVFHTALEQAGFSILNHASHRFPTGGQGVTGVFLLATSHATFHTFPERAYMAVDIFSCGKADPQVVLQLLQQQFSPKQVQTWNVERGGSKIVTESDLP